MMKNKTYKLIALAFVREGAKVVLIYKKLSGSFDKNKADRNACIDIAETILFLASEQARAVTGQDIKVSGGKAL